MWTPWIVIPMLVGLQAPADDADALYEAAKGWRQAGAYVEAARAYKEAHRQLRARELAGDGALDSFEQAISMYRAAQQRDSEARWICEARALFVEYNAALATETVRLEIAESMQSLGAELDAIPVDCTPPRLKPPPALKAAPTRPEVPDPAPQKRTGQRPLVIGLGTSGVGLIAGGAAWMGLAIGQWQEIDGASTATPDELEAVAREGAVTAERMAASAGLLGGGVGLLLGAVPSRWQDSARRRNARIVGGAVGGVLLAVGLGTSVTGGVLFARENFDMVLSRSYTDRLGPSAAVFAAGTSVAACGVGLLVGTLVGLALERPRRARARQVRVHGAIGPGQVIGAVTGRF